MERHKHKNVLLGHIFYVLFNVGEQVKGIKTEMGKSGDVA